MRATPTSPEASTTTSSFVPRMAGVSPIGSSATSGTSETYLPSPKPEATLRGTTPGSIVWRHRGGKDGWVDLVLAKQRVRDARVGRLGTVTPDGRPHLVPVCFALREETVYTAVDAKPKSTLALRRLANIEATPSASLLVDHYDEDWTHLWWVRVDGRPGSCGPDPKLSVPWTP